MSFERQPTASSSQDAPSPRTLTPATNPALRLQELLRRESQQERGLAPNPAPEEIAPEPPALEEVSLAPPPLVSILPPATPRPVEEPVTLIVVVNSERNTPVEYATPDEMPTVSSLEETHQAFLLSDEWQRRGPALLRIIRLRRRRR